MLGMINTADIRLAKTQVHVPRLVAGDLSANAGNNSSPSSRSSTGMQESPTTPQVFPYIYRWNWMGPQRPALRRAVRGKINSYLVMFNDGFTAVTNHNRCGVEKLKVGSW